MTPQMMARIFRDAVAYLTEFGWAQRTSGSPGGQRCILGALSAAAADHGYVVTPATYTVSPLRAAAMYLERHLGLDDYEIHRWNDVPRRTVDEVIRVLLDCAEALDPARELVHA